MYVKVLALSLLIFYCCYGTEVIKRKRKRKNEAAVLSFECTICTMMNFMSLKPACCHEVCFNCKDCWTKNCSGCRGLLPQTDSEWRATFYNISDLDVVEQEPALYFAAKQGNIEAMKALAKNKVDLDQPCYTIDGHTKTPIYIAAEEGHTKLVKFLAKTNGDLDASGTDGKTLVWIAASYGRIEIVEFLAKEKVDLNRADNNGQSPLYAAAEQGHTEIVKFLINGSDKLEENLVVIAKTEEIKQIIREALINRSDFFEAMELGDLEVVKDLAGKVCLNGFDKLRGSPVHIAATQGHTEILRFLATFENVDLNLVDKWERTPVLIAAKQGHTEVVKLLSTFESVGLDQADNRGQTPLWAAAKGGYTEVVKFLATKKNVDLDHADNKGQTPVWIATMFGHTKTVKFLIDKNVKLQRKLLEIAETEIKQLIIDAFQNQSDFMKAVELGELEVVKALAGKVDLNQVNEIGDTPLWRAILHRHTEIVKFLIEKMPRNDKLEKQLLKVEYITSLMRNPGEIEKIVADALEKKRKLEKDFMEAVRAGRLEDVKDLAEKVDLNRGMKYGHLPIYVAARYGRTKIVKFLAAQNVDLKAGNKEIRLHYGTQNEYAIYAAAWFGHTEIVKFLIEKKVTASKYLLEFAKTKKIKRIITEAYKNHCSFLDAVRAGNMDVVKKLAGKVDLNRRTDFGTPVYIAARYGHTEIVQFLATFENVNLNSIISIAVDRDEKTMVEFLIKKKVKLQNNLLDVARTEEMKLIISDAIKNQIEDKLGVKLVKIAKTEKIEQAFKKWKTIYAPIDRRVYVDKNKIYY